MAAKKAKKAAKAKPVAKKKPVAKAKAPAKKAPAKKAKPVAKVRPKKLPAPKAKGKAKPKTLPRKPARPAKKVLLKKAAPKSAPPKKIAAKKVPAKKAPAKKSIAKAAPPRKVTPQPKSPAKAAAPAKIAAPAKAAKAAPAKAAPKEKAAGKAAPATPVSLTPITHEVAIAATADAVFTRLANAAGLTSWLCAEARIDAARGGKAKLTITPDLVLEGRVTEIERGRKLAIDLGGASLVTFTLDSLAGAASRVRLRHEGHQASAAGLHSAHKAVWGTLLRNLKSVVETGLDRRHVGRSIVRSAHVEATPARVWRALTDRHDLARWLCLAGVMDAREGGRFRLDWSGSEHANTMGGSLYAEGAVLALEPERRLELSYHVPKFKQGAHPTLITWELMPEAAGTRLELTHMGFDHDASWSEYYEGHRECWDIDFEELVALCERDNPGKVLRCEVVIDAGRAVGALDAVTAAIGGREIERGGSPEGRYIVCARGAGAGMFGVGNAGRYPRVRAQIEPRDDEMRLTITETHLEPKLDRDAAYAAWKDILAPLARPDAEIKTGSVFG